MSGAAVFVCIAAGGLRGHVAGGRGKETAAAGALLTMPATYGEATESADIVVTMLDAGEKWAGSTGSFY